MASPAADRQAVRQLHDEAHLGIGNVRFERLMPEGATLLERAQDEGWSDEEVAAKSEIAAAEGQNAAAAFRIGVRFSIDDAVAEGLRDDAAVERLVTQVCYRAADLAFLLDREGT